MMRNINMNRFRAFGSALDLQQQVDIIDIGEVEELLGEMYTKLPEYGMIINRVGNNKFGIKFTIDEEDINSIRENVTYTKNNNVYLEKIKAENKKLESELIDVKENYKSVITKNTNLTKEIRKLEKKLFN